jgi:hypothetical protein
MSGLLDQPITFDQLLSWDVRKHYDPEKIQRILNKRHLTVATVALALDVHAAIGACGSFWVIMREELLPARLIHRMSIDLGRTVLGYAQEHNAYIDFRTPQLLDKKELWIENALSLGDYRLAVRRAEEARMLVGELHDALASGTADVICHIGREDARSAFSTAFELAKKVVRTSEFEHRIIDDVRRRIAAVDNEKLATV